GTALADASVAAPLGTADSTARRHGAHPGAAPCRHGVPDTRGQRTAGLRLAGPFRRLGGGLLVRLLWLFLGLGGFELAGAWCRPCHRGATLHPGLSRARAL